MKRLITFALAMVLAAPETLSAQPSEASVAIRCEQSASTPVGEAPNLHGNWDLLMAVGESFNFGLLSIGIADGEYGGSLTFWRTAPVVVRRITLTGNDIHLATATPDGDVVFNGRLSASGERMCGTVTYHGGRTFPLVAHKRPSTYRPQPRQPG